MKKFVIDVMLEGSVADQFLVYAETREDAIRKARGMFTFNRNISADYYDFAAAQLPDDWDFA